ncbi:MAG TPA: xanthine dehydrogenase family protein subunit M [Burkholderiales bacterium]|nr:xanthine dehydrogenase family protein subunit M [Burkholderiales bacterium]
MKPAAFDYVRPANLSEALQALARYGSKGKILAGGQSLVPMMNLRLVRPEVVIDINRLPALDHIRVEGGELLIGALARHSALYDSPIIAQHFPLMSEAYRHVAHKPIRNRGTLGGNVSHADPASEMPAVLLAGDAMLLASSSNTQRRIAAKDFFQGPLQTALKTDELLTEIRIPVAPAGRGYAFEEEATRKGDFALAAVAVLLDVSGGACAKAAIAVAGMGDCATRLREVESSLAGKLINDDAIVQAARTAKQSVTPIASYHADVEFKRDLVEALTARALRRALARCK